MTDKDILEEIKRIYADTGGEICVEHLDWLIDEVEKLRDGPVWKETYDLCRSIQEKNKVIESLTAELESVKNHIGEIETIQDLKKTIEGQAKRIRDLLLLKKELKAVKKERGNLRNTLNDWKHAHKKLEAENAEIKAENHLCQQTIAELREKVKKLSCREPTMDELMGDSGP